MILTDYYGVARTCDVRELLNLVPFHPRLARESYPSFRNNIRRLASIIRAVMFNRTDGLEVPPQRIRIIRTVPHCFCWGGWLERLASPNRDSSLDCPWASPDPRAGTLHCFGSTQGSLLGPNPRPRSAPPDTASTAVPALGAGLCVLMPAADGAAELLCCCWHGWFFVVLTFRG